MDKQCCMVTHSVECLLFANLSEKGRGGLALRLNQKARKRHLNLYLLIRLLPNEAECVDLQVKLVSDRKLARRQKKRFVKLHAKLNDVWSEYEQGTKTARQLLKSCAHIYGPVR